MDRMADAAARGTDVRGSGWATALLWVGWTAAVVCLAYALNGITQAHGSVSVPVAVTHTAPGTGASSSQLTIPGVEVENGWFSPAPIAGVRPAGADGEVTLTAWGSTRAEQALARGDWVVGGLGLLVIAMLLAPVLNSIARGEPFAPGNARRLVLVGTTLAATGLMAPALPAWAGWLVLERTGLAATGRFDPAGGIEPLPLVTAALLVVLAGAFRVGERLARDTEGLV
jgi:hypothetical protein